MAKYYINYHTGAGDFEFSGTLAQAQAAADDDAAYTQAPITIHDAETGEEVSRRNWYGSAYDPDTTPEDDPICFGDYGYYSDWIIW